MAQTIPNAISTQYDLPLYLCPNDSDIEPNEVWPEIWGEEWRDRPHRTYPDSPWLVPEAEIFGTEIWEAAVREVNEYCPDPFRSELT